MPSRGILTGQTMRKLAAVCCAIALTGGGALCANAPAPRVARTQAAAPAPAPANVPAKKMAREFVDEAGRHVTVPGDVRRIVSLAPNLTEIVYALGAQNRLAGVSAYSDYPPEAKAKLSVGMPVNPSLEAIAGAQPDVVLATSAINRLETVKALEQAGIAVYATDPHTVEGTLESIRHIGEVIGAEAQAEALVARLQQQLDALKSKLAGVVPSRVLFVVWDDPLISVGDNTFIADALRWAGAESVVHARQNWPQVSLEEVVRLSPDYLIYASGEMDTATDAENGESPNDTANALRDAIAERLAELRGKDGWRGLAAVREGRVAVISDEVDLPAPGLIDAIEQLARELHPEAFTQKPAVPVSAREERLASRASFALRQRMKMEEIQCAR